ncbi:alpha-amylase family glycosyl hydrolase [Candidatus Thiosymbion oneisti]|uniref:alpha-amylase family glycosyl hydrolase n=1 Tax=Candidatus Thiosymbion oneisti TaxID=589554 RepID=UPI000B039345|nr:alpha-amylase family glycosyl hydrolase [Candidatus Thiosymbion oneisti]
MALIPVHFEYRTGLKPQLFTNARLGGTWDSSGRLAEDWRFTPMQEFTANDGCPAFRVTVELDDSQIGQIFRWGVSVDTATTPDRWGIPTEVSATDADAREQVFTLQGIDQTECYYLTHCRRLGANKLFIEDRTKPAIRFAVWAPHAREVELVFGDRESGYIYPDGRGINERFPRVALHKEDETGIWFTDGAVEPALADFAAFDHQPYMYRITRDDGSVAYRTDLYSRCQIGTGRVNPADDAPWSGNRSEVDGTKSCSVVVDPEGVCRPFRQLDAQGRPVWPETDWVEETDFWKDEFDPEKPLPTRLQDLVIYELHVDGLGFGRRERGLLEDAIDLLDYLAELGVNCVELMPTSEFEGWSGWGYGTSHYLAVEYAAGGRDQFKHFVRACHRRGIAVLLDVVYNHYTHDGERAQWAYDSTAPERNIYYWYEGRPNDYPSADGGYIDNMSTGYAPRYWEEMVRKLFISSAAQLVAEFHLDGFRVDQTTSIHSYAVVHADGRAADNARIFGAKFLREWTRTLKLIKPNLFLTAEDHSGWPLVTASNENGGLGFDAVWFADYYHHLIGDAQNDASRARLLKFAGYGDDRSLNMSWFAGVLAASAQQRVVYHESHDEAGNSYYQEGGQDVHSARTLVVAVNGAQLTGETRRYAEARTCFAAGVTLLGPGVPMFLMGEEVGASEPYRYDDFLAHREDFPVLRRGVGSRLFRFYQDAIRLRLRSPALRSANIEVVYVHDADRLLVFRRWDGPEDFLVVASLSNRDFPAGYEIRNGSIADGTWRELLNSDASVYGGSGLGNAGGIHSLGGVFTPRLAANSVLVFQRQ